MERSEHGLPEAARRAAPQDAGNLPWVIERKKNYPERVVSSFPSFSVPHISLVKGQPVFGEQRPKFVLKRKPLMMRLLFFNVLANPIQAGGAHRKSTITGLPGKFDNLRKSFPDPQIGAAFEFLDDFGLRNAASQSKQEMNMIGNSADTKWRAIQFFGNPSEKSMNLPADIAVRKERESLFGGKNHVQINAGQGLWHGSGKQPHSG
jgi:hypothetical protein